MKVGITGASGMIGWQLRCFLNQFDSIGVATANRRHFASRDALSSFAADCDFIVHLAAVNRGSDEEVTKTNPRLAKKLVEALLSCGTSPHVIYSSSIQISHGTPYGAAKKAAGEILARWAQDTGANYTNLVLPHVFGEGGRPFHNSVVATFAHQLANDQEPQLIDDAELELLHASQVCQEIYRIVVSGSGGHIRLTGTSIRVSEVMARLRKIANSYREDVVPDLRDPMTRQFFNLYRSFLYPNFYPRRLKANSDERGRLFEAIKNLNGGQTFYSTTKPGITRGDHYHYQKVERFLVVQGKARIRIRRLFDDSIHVFDVDGNTPAFIDMPVLHTHNITNTGESDLTTLFWSNEIFDPSQPDTVHCMVDPPDAIETTGSSQQT